MSIELGSQKEEVKAREKLVACLGWDWGGRLLPSRFHVSFHGSGNGWRRPYAIISMSDVPRQPFLVVTSSDSQKTATLEMFIKQMTNTTRGRTQVHRANDTALLIGEQDVLQRVRTTQPAKRPEIASAFSAGKSSPVKVLLVPSADQRRAIAETLPQLPPDWGDATGKEISDGVQW